MLQHPYWLSAKAEQRQEAIERDRLEAIRYLEQTRERRLTGRVLEAIETKH
ncbi:hypothetical protein [Mesorhizobium sp.]|uniref:hypothetical protein n=1 Tax=Mesorhizobium sp. TaxID=1871066 RepID=UPI00257CE325|nr:hypothetical protein [Mesorhizobium sp.]